MNRLLASVVVVAGLMLPTLGMAKELKIGFVDGTRLSQEAPQAVEAADKLTKEFEPQREALVKEQDALKESHERFLKDSAFMSAADKQKKERELASAERELRLKQTEFQEDLTIRRNEEFAQVMESLRSAIQKYGKDNGFDLILFEGVSYASDRVNITEPVLQELGKKK